MPTESTEGSFENNPINWRGITTRKAVTRDQYVELWRQLPAEYVVLIYHWAQQPAESVVRQLELFMEHVKPALDEMTPYEA